jgi:hypothetical protein
MEQILNCAWLLVSLAALTWWALMHRRATAERRLRLLHGAAIIACALVLLFPAISATDDLHGAQMMQDDGAAKKLRSQASPVSVAADSPRFLTLLADTVRPSDFVLGRLDKESVRSIFDFSPLPASGRAPPTA